MKNKIKYYWKVYGIQLLILVTVVFGFFGSYIYYSSQSPVLLKGPMLVFTSMYSTIKLYMFAPTVSVTEKANFFYKAAMFMAPICTTIAAVKALEKVMKNMNNKLFGLGKEQVFVYGYNKKSRVLMDNLMKEKKSVILLADSGVSEDEKLHLLKNGVVIISDNYASSNMEYMNNALRRLHMKKNALLILFSEDSASNFALLYSLTQFVKQKKNKTGEFILRIRVWCPDRGLKTILSKLDKETPLLDIATFHLEELAVNEALATDKHPLYRASCQEEGQEATVVPDSERTLDRHIMVLGFNELGQEFVAQSICRGIVSEDNLICFDIFDENPEKKKECFLNRFSPESVREYDSSATGCSTVVIGNTDILPHTDALLDKIVLRFHPYGVYSREFESEIQSVAADINYACIAFENSDESAYAMEALTFALPKVETILVRMEMNDAILEYINQNGTIYKNVYTFYEMKKILNYQTIAFSNLEAIAMNANAKYEEFANHFLFGRKSQVISEAEKMKKWNQLSMYAKNSNRGLAMHQEVKEEIIKQACMKEALHWNITELCNRFCDEKTGIMNTEQVLKVLEETPLLQKMIYMEHRRWVYFHYVNGFRYRSKEQLLAMYEREAGKINQKWQQLDGKTQKKISSMVREEFKVHDCILSYDQLVADRADTLVYDLISWFLILKEHENK